MNENEPLFIDTGADAPHPDLPFVERDAVAAVVHDPKTDTYLGLRWKEVGWETLVTGGIESGQTAEEAARAEILEETGYKNLQLVRTIPGYHAKFYHAPKGVNRFAHFKAFLFELIDDEQEPVSAEEKAKHEAVWLSREELQHFNLPEGPRFLVDQVLAS